MITLNYKQIYTAYTNAVYCACKTGALLSLTLIIIKIRAINFSNETNTIICK